MSTSLSMRMSWSISGLMLGSSEDISLRILSIMSITDLEQYPLPLICGMIPNSDWSLISERAT